MRRHAEPGGWSAGFGPFQVLLWLALALAIPSRPASWNRDVSFVLLTVTWAGVLTTTSFAYLSSRGLSITLFPCFASLLAVTGYNGPIEAAFAASTFVGFMGYSTRIGRPAGLALARSLRMTLVTWTALRTARLAVHSLLPRPSGSIEVLAAMFLALSVFILASVLLRGLGAGGRLFRSDTSLARMLHGFSLPAAFCPLLLPAAADIVPGGKSGDMMLLVGGSAALIAAQAATTISLERSKWAQGRAFSVQKALSTLSSRLTSAGGTVDALHVLARESASAFRPRAVLVRAGNLIVRGASRQETQGRPLVRTGSGGVSVEIWPDEGTILDPVRLDSFISQTETALQSLELGKRLSLEAWSCMEAMIYSLDRADHRLAGHSRRVARLSVEIGRRMGLQSGLLDSLRMSALLHHVASTVLHETSGDAFEDRDLSMFSLPEETVSILKSVNENYDGTGSPQGLYGSSIPIASRILSVADEYVTELERGDGHSAANAVKLRAGTLFDPAVVAAHLGLVAGDFEI